jgi:type II secretory pathway component HofQ
MLWPATYRWGFYAALVCGLLIAVELWERRLEQRGYDRAQSEFTQQAILASESARQRERELQQQVKDAENEAKQREKAILADATAVLTERDRLRSEIANSRNRMSEASFNAVRKYTSTLSSVFEECAGQLEDMARSAAGHASDSLMYQTGWWK